MDLLTMLAFFQAEKMDGPLWYTTLLPVLFFFAVLYFIVLRPQMKQQREHGSMVDSLKKGDKVITTGGVWGEIDSVEPKVIRLKISEKQKIMVSRTAISGLQPGTGKEEAEKA